MNLIVRHVSVTYPSAEGPVQVLRHADLTLTPGKITALVGESGSGKSILGAAVMGLLEEDAEVTGHIFCGKTDLLSLSEEERNRWRGRRIGWIAQDPVSAMDPVIPVGKQVTEAERFFHRIPKGEERRAALAQMKRFGLGEAESVYGKYPGELSGGMAQRVLTAMMTMPSPEWIVADEPTKGLDAFVRREVSEAFRRLRDEKGTGFLLITHDLRLAERLADRVGIMYAGEILEEGPVKEVFSHPLHPYTKALLAAQPRRDLRPIPGLPPNLSKLTGGCIFKNRCPFYEKGPCDEDRPMTGADGHQARCRGGQL